MSTLSTHKPSMQRPSPSPYSSHKSNHETKNYPNKRHTSDLAKEKHFSSSYHHPNRKNHDDHTSSPISHSRKNSSIPCKESSHTRRLSPYKHRSSTNQHINSFYTHRSSTHINTSSRTHRSPSHTNKNSPPSRTRAPFFSGTSSQIRAKPRADYKSNSPPFSHNIAFPKSHEQNIKATHHMQPPPLSDSHKTRDGIDKPSSTSLEYPNSKNQSKKRSPSAFNNNFNEITSQSNGSKKAYDNNIPDETNKSLARKHHLQKETQNSRKRRNMSRSSSTSSSSSSSSASSSSSSSASSDSQSVSSSGKHSRKSYKKVTKEEKSPKMSVRQFQKVREQLMKDSLGYSNQNNPFGDSTLTQPFIWKRKKTLQKAMGDSSHKTTIDSLLLNTRQKVSEIQSVKKRREEREVEEAMLEEQRQLLAREKEQENYDDWLEKEEKFHQQQAIQKTQTRIEQGREKPLDTLMKGIKVLKGETFSSYAGLSISPYQIFDDCSIEDTEEMLNDIQIFIQNEEDKDYKEFWDSLLVLCNNALRILRHERLTKEASKMSISIAPFRDVESHLPLSILTQIEALLSHKCPEELYTLQQQIAHKLTYNTEDTDPTYWEAIQYKLPIYLARSITQQFQQKWSKIIQNIQTNTQTQIQPSPTIITDVNKPSKKKKEEEIEEENVGQYSPVLEPYDNDILPITDTYEDEHEIEHEHSPSIHNMDEFDEFEEFVLPMDDYYERLEAKEALVMQHVERRRLLLQQTNTHTNKHTNEDIDLIDPALKMITFEDFVRKEKKQMPEDEQIMTSNLEFSLNNHYLWEEKYRARKPRYFNRVKSGYEWSKYNQTHYDRDNPPPKAVQGYKFNIFYPDLIEKTKAPSWSLQPCIDNHDNVIIRFHAGPPYEDIAFKIINREWSTDTIRGFRNTFDKGILQLHFTFKRYRYRR